MCRWDFNGLVDKNGMFIESFLSVCLYFFRARKVKVLHSVPLVESVCRQTEEKSFERLN